MGQQRAQPLVLAVDQLFLSVRPGQRRRASGEALEVDLIRRNAVDRADDGREERHPLGEHDFIHVHTEVLKRGLGLLIFRHQHRQRPGIVDTLDHRIPVPLERGHVLVAVLAGQVQQTLGDGIAVEILGVVAECIQEACDHAHQKLCLRQAVAAHHHVGARVAGHVDQVVVGVGGADVAVHHLERKNLVLVTIADLVGQPDRGPIHGVHAVDTQALVALVLGFDGGAVQREAVAHQLGHQAGEVVALQAGTLARVALPARVGEELLEQRNGLLFISAKFGVRVFQAHLKPRPLATIGHAAEPFHLPDAGEDHRRQDGGLIDHAAKHVERHAAPPLAPLAHGVPVGVIHPDRLHAGLAVGHSAAGEGYDVRFRQRLGEFAVLVLLAHVLHHRQHVGHALWQGGLLRLAHGVSPLILRGGAVVGGRKCSFGHGRSVPSRQ